MEELNYEKLKFKSGLEIHQQLNTNKLFCECPSILRKDEPDFVIKRKLHAVAGESGKVDEAALYQTSLGKEFIYQGYDTTCLVELDEEPPHSINKEALKIALQISLLLNAKILPLTQIMRKTVIDGSNTSGFQRTILIAINGSVETEKGKVGIQNICLEEDAARKIEESENTAVYRLDRLGIPLIEIVTAPDIKSPEQMKEVALHIGGIIRSFNVKRGIGTIRQDINISIHGGNRIEIKGFQDPSMMIKTINAEIRRQLDTLKKGEKVKSEVRKALPEGNTEFLRPMPGAARMYPETDLSVLKISREIINEAKKDMPKMRKDIEEELKHKGLNEEMIKILFKEDKFEEFRELLEITDNPLLVAKIILIFPKEILIKEKIPLSESEKIFNKNLFAFVLESFRSGKISESQIKNVLEKIAKGEKLETAILFEKEDTNIIEKKIMEIVKEKQGLSENAYMGLVMKEFKGKIDGKYAREIIAKLLK